MARSEHFLVVRADADLWALPMQCVEQTFDLSATKIRGVGRTRVVCFRGSVLEVHDLAQLARGGRGSEQRAVVLWAGGHRRVFTVDELVGQMLLERLEMPALFPGHRCAGVVFLGA